MDPLHSWALDFFSGYREAFDRADPEGIVDAYTMPTVFVTDAGTHVVGDRSALESGVRGLLATYREAGFHHAVIRVASAREVSERLRSVDLHWQIVGPEDKLLWAFDVQYVLRLIEPGYRIAVVVNPAGR